MKTMLKGYVDLWNKDKVLFGLSLVVMLVTIALALVIVDLFSKIGTPNAPNLVEMVLLMISLGLSAYATRMSATMLS